MQQYGSERARKNEILRRGSFRRCKREKRKRNRENLETERAGNMGKEMKKEEENLSKIKT